MSVELKENYKDGIGQIQAALNKAKTDGLFDVIKDGIRELLTNGLSGQVSSKYEEYKSNLVEFTKANFVAREVVEIKEAGGTSLFSAPSSVDPILAEPMDNIMSPFEASKEDLTKTMMIPTVDTAVQFNEPTDTVVQFTEPTNDQVAFQEAITTPETLEPQTQNFVAQPEVSDVFDLNPNEAYETEEPVYSEENTNEKGKVRQLKRFKRSAAYVDTVILCLIAQLGIFGLLIVVLLIIK